MKKVLLISLLAVHLFSSTELFELVKLPVLFHHFLEHKNKDNHISFSDFIKMHYATHGSISNDDDDMKLPFKSHEGAPVITILALIPNYYCFSTRNIFHEAKSFFISDEDFVKATLLSCIWQPPKFC